MQKRAFPLLYALVCVEFKVWWGIVAPVHFSAMNLLLVYLITNSVSVTLAPLQNEEKEAVLEDLLSVPPSTLTFKAKAFAWGLVILVQVLIAVTIISLFLFALGTVDSYCGFSSLIRRKIDEYKSQQSLRLQRLQEFEERRRN